MHKIQITGNQLKILEKIIPGEFRPDFYEYVAPDTYEVMCDDAAHCELLRLGNGDISAGIHAVCNLVESGGVKCP